VQYVNSCNFPQLLPSIELTRIKRIQREWRESKEPLTNRPRKEFFTSCFTRCARLETVLLSSLQPSPLTSFLSLGPRFPLRLPLQLSLQAKPTAKRIGWGRGFKGTQRFKQTLANRHCQDSISSCDTSCRWLLLRDCIPLCHPPGRGSRGSD
jgi:hypothetical protein